jgi:hypothetical protein
MNYMLRWILNKLSNLEFYVNLFQNFENLFEFAVNLGS